MEGAWLISYLVLWCLTLLLGLVILAHSRLLGLLHHRLRPSAARLLADGPELGSKLDRLEGQLLDGRRWNWTFPAATDRLMIFVSPQCQTCNELIPHIKDFVRAHRDVEVVLMSILDHLLMNQAYVAYRRLEGLTYVISAKLADDLNIEGTPYALYLDRQGVLTGKGLVNHYEHLLSLRQSAPLDRVVPQEDEQELGSPNVRSRP